MPMATDRSDTDLYRLIYCCLQCDRVSAALTRYGVRRGRAADGRVQRNTLGAHETVLARIGLTQHARDVVGRNGIDESGRVVRTTKVASAAARHSAADDVAAEAGRTSRWLTEHTAERLTRRRLETLDERCRATAKSNLPRCRSLDFRCNSRMSSPSSDSGSSRTNPSADTLYIRSLNAPCSYANSRVHESHRPGN
jgi:hypothetical protein